MLLELYTARRRWAPHSRFHLSFPLAATLASPHFASRQGLGVRARQGQTLLIRVGEFHAYHSLHQPSTIAGLRNHATFRLLWIHWASRWLGLVDISEEKFWDNMCLATNCMIIYHEAMPYACCSISDKRRSARQLLSLIGLHFSRLLSLNARVCSRLTTMHRALNISSLL